MTDQELLLRLKDARSATTSNLARRLLARDLYKPVYIGRVLKDDDLKLQSVEDVQHAFGKVKGFATPEGRDAIEKSLARKAKINDLDVIVFYPPNAPGIKKIETWVENEPGRVSKPDYLTDPEYGQLVKRHLALWKVYVFVAREIESSTKSRIAEEAQLLIGRMNEKSHETNFQLDL